MQVKNLIASAIILDLDDTIFETKSMDKNLFEPFFNHLASTLATTFNQETIHTITKELWEKPMGEVFHKYAISFSSMAPSLKILENTYFTLNIKTYDDYDFIKNLQVKKFLVTSGLTGLQEAKIKSLNIQDDFDQIIINDSSKNSETKQDIFNQLIIDHTLIPQTTFVVGDNPDSEIKAGNSLNMVTIQILRNNTAKGKDAHYYIHSFHELHSILG